MTQQLETTLSEAFSKVLLTDEQAAGILQKMAELFVDSAPEVREAFLVAANQIITGVDTP